MRFYKLFYYNQCIKLHSIQHNLLPVLFILKNKIFRSKIHNCACTTTPAISMHTNTHVDDISSKSTEEHRIMLPRFRLDELNVLITHCVDKLKMKLPVILIALCIVPLDENKRVSIYLFSF